jgi:hypothetical protein
MLAMLKLILIIAAIFIGAAMLRGAGIKIENVMGILVVGGGLLFFMDWCFQK